MLIMTMMALSMMGMDNGLSTLLLSNLLLICLILVNIVPLLSYFSTIRKRMWYIYSLLGLYVSFTNVL